MEKFMTIGSVLTHTTFGALATTNSDGSPWVIPIHVFADDNQLYWLSDETTRHSQNIDKDTRVSFTAWAAPDGEKSKGLYVSGKASKLDKSQTAGVYSKMIETIGIAPPVSKNTYAYKLPIGRVDSDRTKENRWYFYS